MKLLNKGHPMTTKQAPHMESEKSEDKSANTQKIDFSGKTFAFYGDFNFWPSYHPGRPAEVARQLGALVCHEVDDNLDYLVLGEKRGTGKSEAKKSAEKLQNYAAREQKKGKIVRYPQIIDESLFREWTRIDVKGKSFCFYGGFDCCGGELDDQLLSRMVEGAGGTVTKSLDGELDYFVLGNRRGTGKIAAHNQVQKLQAAGAKVQTLTEEGFLELVRVERPSGRSDTTDGDGTMDFAAFISQLHGTVDQAKLARAIKMLKAEAFKLYVKKGDNHLVGVVRSQTGKGNVYASWLTPEGRYGCSTPELDDCMGLQGSVCKHLLVLVVGLTRAGEMDTQQAYNWVHAAQGKRPKTDTDLAASTFIQYKGVEVGEIDWRPTETMPEDFYAF